MDYTPRAETIRLLAAGAYLPLVAPLLLFQRRHRDVRLIRFHAYQAIGLTVFLLVMLLLGSIVSTLFGGMPGLGYLINLGVGLFYAGALLGVSAIGFYGAIMAYQGNYTNVPILTDWVWMQVNGSGRPELRKKRPRRKAVRPPEEDWEADVEEREEERF